MKAMHKKMCIGSVCLLCILSSCGLKVIPDEEKINLKVAVFDGAYDVSYWKEVSKDFEEEHKNVNVQLEINSNIGNILMPKLSSNNVPDVVYLGSTNNSGYTQKMLEEQLIAPLDDAFVSLEEKFLPNLLDSKLLRPYEDERLYLAPLYYNVTGFWYNAQMFKEYGYELPTTWDEFFVLGDQAKADGKHLFIYQGMNPSYLEAMLWPMLAEKIGLDGLYKIFNNEEDAWDQEGVAEVLAIFERIAQNGYMGEDTIALTYREAQKRFVQGDALFIPCGNWLEEEMQEEIDESDDFTFINIPSFEENAPSYTQVMLEQIYVPKDAKQVELGKAFVAFQFTNDNVAKNEKMSGGVVPIKEGPTRLTPPQPFQVFEQGTIPITSDFVLEKSLDMNNEVFEQLSSILARTSTAEDMMEVLNTFHKGLK